ncbi:hypothetical protein IFU23_06475 [Pantoea agglomerans]|uniref:Uncharacterized protein n=1 Tax=Enterobacter agglomerans TaxID=549 RepID=A0ACC5PX28_ENTAG|nr:hypothetical protein [Pantoea agglomerans]MBD8129242.1 hypothetical protein [Pantoea agglomerans]MBD8153800.1 hypothetical protein [Pantoea agglomerans]MBD8157752.1 hypothetical protein [Pantoea agglomerans]MBD8231591.1 hypothetical protein [Pantoea agglomerans]MBD8241714.1 hypothetical protein [Pantoea agglomerans]
MSVTFNDLKAKNKELNDRIWKLREKLQDEAARFVREYCESLSVPGNNTWTDVQGNQRSYVQVGHLGQDGKFEAVNLARLQLDDDYTLRFFVATTLDDSSQYGGQLHCTPVALSFDGYWLKAFLNGGSDDLEFNVSPKAGGYEQVCSALKALILKGLDDAMPVMER